VSYEEDEEIKALLEKRRAQIEKAAKERQKQAEIQAEMERAYILRSILTEEARERLERIKLARPHFAKMIEDQLILLAKSGRIQGVITDEDLKNILKQLTGGGSKRDSNIRIMRKGL